MHDFTNVPNNIRYIDNSFVCVSYLQKYIHRDVVDVHIYALVMLWDKNHLSFEHNRLNEISMYKYVCKVMHYIDTYVCMYMSVLFGGISTILSA